MCQLKCILFLVVSVFIFSQLSGQDGNDATQNIDWSEKESNKDADTKEKEEKKESAKEDAKDAESKEEEKEEPPKIGNFVLPGSQQPSGLFAFGGNIIDKGEVQFYFFADEFVGRNKNATTLIPNVVFGITEKWSVNFNFPFTPLLIDDGHHSSGLADFFIQLEYAFYNKSTYCYIDQATLVGNITVPTGSIHKDPPTGFGAPSLFLGGTYYRMMVEWFFFTSHGAVLTCSDHRTKFGEQFLYQFGLGRNFPSPEGWIYAWMLEVDGQYNRKNRIHGSIDPDSGGNSIFVTPSLWFSSREFLIQFGVSLPINQNLFGHQRKFDYAFNFNIAWSYY